MLEVRAMAVRVIVALVGKFLKRRCWYPFDRCLRMRLRAQSLYMRSRTYEMSLGWVAARVDIESRGECTSGSAKCRIYMRKGEAKHW